MNLKDDIKIAQLIVSGNIKREYKSFHNHSFIYKTTNENIRGVLDKIKIKPNSKILTVSSSMDQALSFALFNPKKIDCFDITNFSKYFCDLKVSAIINLEYEEYIKFFFKCDNYEEEFSEDIYAILRNNLSEESKMFWDSLYNFFEGYEIYNSFLFSTEYYSLTKVLRNNLYLDKENYYKLKEYLEQIIINYKNMDIIKDEMSRKYDLVYLSNLLDYYDKELYKKRLETLGILNEDALAITYLYDYERKKDYYSLFLDDEHYKIQKLNNKDAVMVYKKTN